MPETPRKGIADIIIGKQRNGPVGEVHLTFLGEFTKFENLVAEAYGKASTEAAASGRDVGPRQPARAHQFRKNPIFTPASWITSLSWSCAPAVRCSCR